MEQSAPSRLELEKAVAIIAAELARCKRPQTELEQQLAIAENRAKSEDLTRVKMERRLLPEEVRILAAVIDHTQLRPEATAQAIETLCEQALENGLGAVCVNSAWAPLALEKLRASPVKLASVCGFPLGAILTSAKQAEAAAILAAGVREIDMVMNIGAMKSGQHGLVESDIASVVEVCERAQVPVKVIIENCFLTREEKVQACEIAQRAGASFVKTSTGFAASGATEADVRLMRETVGPKMGVKAAGGIRTLADALRMIQAGATRLGTSAGHTIVAEAAGIMNGKPLS
jgi:deoxyribose-phosphate aldolase